MTDTVRRPTRTWFDVLIDVLAVIAGGLMVGLTAMICVDVMSRYFRLFAMPWSLDVAEWSLLVITFLGAPWVLREGGHISIDIFVGSLPPAVRKRVEVLSHLLGALICVVLLFYSTWELWNSFSAGTTVHETYVYPEWLLFTVAPPVFLILACIFLRWLVRPPGTAGTAASDGI